MLGVLHVENVLNCSLAMKITKANEKIEPGNTSTSNRLFLAGV
jgi:hypothetical protein